MSESGVVYATGFNNDLDGTKTIIPINDNSSNNHIKISGSVSAQYEMDATPSTDDCKDLGIVNSINVVLLPGKSINTLFKK